MKEKFFSIKDVLSRGWESWKQNWFLWIGAVAISFLLGSVGNLSGFFKKSDITETIFQILGILLSAYATLGIINLALRTAKGLKVTLSDYFDTWPYYVRFLLGQILYFTAVSLGLVLFIVPGIILGLMFYLFPYFIIEKNLGVIDSFKASSRAVYGTKWHLFLFSAIGILLNILGLLCLVIGLFISIPVVAIAQAVIYKILSSRLEEIPRVEEK